MQTHPFLLANEKGSVIVLAMIILALLTLVGISAVTTSTTEMNIAANDQLNKMIFYTADAGVEVGRHMLNTLKAADPAAWDRLLQGSTFTWRDSNTNPITVSNLNQAIEATSTRQVGLGTFTLQVSDNDDLDGNTLVDTDDMVVLTSTATGPNSQAQVRVTVRYTGAADSYAQENYDSRKSGANANESAAVQNNQRW
jgi:Tfp pilus assembly protein PilX